MESISNVFDKLIEQATGEKRRYDKKEWVKRKQPRRARFHAKVLWHDKGCTGPFYTYDFEQRNTGQGLLEEWKVDGQLRNFMHNEHVGLIKLLHWINEEKKRWYCVTIYGCTDITKLTGKYTDERAEYSHEIYKVVQSRNAAKAVNWFNKSLKFDESGMVERGRLKAFPAPRAQQLTA